MAGSEESIDKDKRELIAALDATRVELADDFDDVGELLNIPGQIRESFQDDKWKWLGGALVAGLVTGLLIGPSRRKNSSKTRLSGGKPSLNGAPPAKRSLVMLAMGSLARGGFELARPALTKMARDAVEKWTNSHLPKQ